DERLSRAAASPGAERPAGRHHPGAGLPRHPAAGVRDFAMSVRLFPLALVCGLAALTPAADPPARTSLSDPAIRYRVPEKPYVVLRRAGVEAGIGTHPKGGGGVVTGHPGGDQGVGALEVTRPPRNH